MNSQEQAAVAAGVVVAAAAVDDAAVAADAVVVAAVDALPQLQHELLVADGVGACEDDHPLERVRHQAEAA